MTDDDASGRDTATAADLDRDRDAAPDERDAPTLPPNPAEYDSPRAAAARARGLAAPYIAGGRDPEPERGIREERFYGRILIAMVAIIVLAGFVLGIVAVLLNLPGAE